MSARARPQELHSHCNREVLFGTHYMRPFIPPQRFFKPAIVKGFLCVSKIPEIKKNASPLAMPLTGLEPVLLG